MNRHINRRTFLRGAGVCLSLPILSAMPPALGASPESKSVPRRMVAIQPNMGFMPRFWFPESAGRDWESTRYLNLLSDFRADMTLFSGVSHPEVDGGHAAEVCFLTAAPHPGRGGFKNTVSLDQVAAEHVGVHTRFPSLALGVSTRSSMSFTSAGVRLPAEDSPSNLFKQLFVKGSKEEVAQRMDEFGRGKSILDFVRDEARTHQRKLGPADRRRLDQYFTSVRDLEQRLVTAEAWQHKPKPEVNVPQPKDTGDKHRLIENSRLMYDMIRLALETDSSRVITLYINSAYVQPPLPGVESPVHPLTHHGNRPDIIAELATVEEAQFKEFANFLTGLKSVEEDGIPLLDRTMVLYGAAIGDANRHSNHNLPVLLAGGGFKHGGHLAFDTARGKNYPLPNLFVSMLQRLGIERDRFASSTGTMRGFEMA